MDALALSRVGLWRLNLQCSTVDNDLVVKRASVKDVNDVLQNVHIFDLVALSDDVDDELLVDKLIVERLVMQDDHGRLVLRLNSDLVGTLALLVLLEPFLVLLEQ